MKKITNKLLFGFSLLSALTAQASLLQDHLLITAKLDGAQQVPAVTTNALGVASFSLNASRDTMCVSVTVNGLSGAIMSAHVHEGAVGVSGGVITDLSTFISGNHINGILTGANLTTAMIAKYLSGAYYINVHTAANPNGEIRGQLWLETDYGYTAKLDGAQEVPAVTTTAYGLGTFNLSKDQSKLKFYVVAQGLSGAITAAHFHTGAMGVDGPVSTDLTTMINGNIISGEVDPTAFLTDLKAGNIYINMHTTANAGGEIRGQLKYDTKLTFDARLNGAQQVPAIITNAAAISSIKLNNTLDTLWYDVVADGLSGAITSSHFHAGAAGVSGSVVIDLSASVVGNRITDTIVGAALTPALINNFLKGDIYLNIHTTANPNGEIRGQVYRLAREGFTISLDGAQESPSVATSATGSGIVSIDRDQTNAHFMIVARGLSGTLSGVHFHNAAVGVSGGVINDLAASFTSSGENSSGFGYWKSTDATPFTSASSTLFQDELVYINIHTAANPNGEIRGQVLRKAPCASAPTTIVESESKDLVFSVYPNPVAEVVNLSINSIDAIKAEITISNVLGEKILSETLNLRKGSNTHTINSSNLSRGVYFIHFQLGDQTVVERLIKQ